MPVSSIAMTTFGLSEIAVSSSQNLLQKGEFPVLQEFSIPSLIGFRLYKVMLYTQAAYPQEPKLNFWNLKHIAKAKPRIMGNKNEWQDVLGLCSQHRASKVKNFLDTKWIKMML